LLTKTITFDKNLISNMIGSHLQRLLVFGLLGHSTARSLNLSQRDICAPDSPRVTVSIIKDVSIYPVYVSTYYTSKTRIIIKEGLTIDVTRVPTQIVTSGVVTTTCISTQTEYPTQ